MILEEFFNEPPFSVRAGQFILVKEPTSKVTVPALMVSPYIVQQIPVLLGSVIAHDSLHFIELESSERRTIHAEI